MDRLWTSGRAVLVAGVVGIVASALPALADEWRPVEPGRWIPGTPMTDSQHVTDWSGFYVGGKLGGIWSDIHWSENFVEFTAPAGANMSPGGVAGGVFGGANLQMGNWIFGLETSFLGTGLNGSSRPNAVDTFKTQIDWLLFVEPRLGFSWDRQMVYVKGGWVGGDATLTATGPTGGGQFATAKATEFVDGWTIGGGIEYAWWPSVIVGLDYQYINLKLSQAASCDLCLVGIADVTAPDISGNADISLVMLRASYLFRPED